MSQLSQEQIEQLKQSIAPQKTYALMINWAAKNSQGQEVKFYKDSTIIARDIPVAANQKVIPYVVTSDGIKLPKNVLKEVPAIVIDSQKDMIGQTKTIMNSGSFKQGAFIGAAGGAAYGFFTNRNMFYTVMLGMIFGGATWYFIKTNNKEKTNTQ